jgi:flagella basal body P-ring formation protein FlgA
VSSALALEIRFLAETEIESPMVTLGDIAEFDASSSLTEALASKQICPAPKPGETLSLATAKIASRLNSNLRNQAPISWVGSDTVRISRTGVTIGHSEIEDTINQYIEGRLSSLPQAEYSFVPRELPLPFTLAKGTLQTEVIPGKPGVIASRRFTITYRIDGKIVKNISIRGQLKALAPVAVLTMNVPRNSILQPDMVQLQIRDLSTLRSPCTDLREVLGKKLTRHLRSGSVLDLSSIKFPPVIQKGQLVKILISGNGMQLTATGIASMNGKQDQVIRVMNSGSKKIVYCKVTAPGLVEVQI